MYAGFSGRFSIARIRATISLSSDDDLPTN